MLGGLCFKKNVFYFIALLFFTICAYAQETIDVRKPENPQAFDQNFSSTSISTAAPQIAISSETKKDIPFDAYTIIQSTHKPKYVRGIHITGWAAGSRKYRGRIDPIIRNTEINTIVIAVKEVNGDVYIPGAKEADAFEVSKNAMPDIESYLKYLKELGIYTSARIVVFKDHAVAEKKTEWAVKTSSGTIWRDYKKAAWLDPYNKDVWEYNFTIVDQCIELGFDEIQFDYIRFPSDGKIAECVYSVPHSSTSAVQAITDFLKEASERYRVARGIPVSIDVFGLTTSAKTDMGIGQIITRMAPYVDYICPMVYPSHYKRGAYDIPYPNSEPYKTVFIALKNARKRLGKNTAKLRPYLQDFSLGYPYGEKEVRDQIQAAYNNDIGEWTLWNAGVRYTQTALLPKNMSDTYEKIEISTETVSGVLADVVVSIQ